ncbi:uncharacterized protein vito [Lepeophtheirus salmonis]|uniref:Nucleolar protein 12 n=1 Tax=Lepeophtheirus salmonis TaxID=72036 RepID=D3PIV8_LEPSM|nr:nucleolar protein 12-like [Lepeophtheirus salmonis]ADD38494.1 Nucleolar protein 12 [Lepeophtheirus salmonis]
MGNTRRPKNRKTKTSVEFNEEERVSFLTGFRKRKNERRKQAKVQMDKEFKEQLAEAREKARNSMRTSSSSYILPEVESLLPESTIKTDTHTVSITPMDSLLTPDVSMDPQTFIKPSEKKTINKLTLKAVAKSRAFKMKKQAITKSSSNNKFDRKTMLTKRKKHFHPRRTIA